MRATTSTLTLLLTASCLASNAWAWDPNAGAENAAPVARYTRAATPSFSQLPITATTAATPRANIAPQPPIIAPLPAVAASAAPTPMVIAPPETRIVPIQNTYSQAATPTAPAYVAPAVVPYYAPQQTPASSYKANRYTLGAEGFWDRYREPSATVKTNSGFAGLDGSWSHYYDPSWFSTVELRGTFGKEDYKSDSGKLNDTDAWEYEARVLAGYDAPTGDHGHVKPYIGLDMRYYSDEGKGNTTNLGAAAYDRRIFQIMAPIGVTYDIPVNGFHFLPTIEAGPLLFGNVSSRIGTVPGYYNIDNQQHSGWEMRGDFMMNNLNDQGRGWEFGPFARYWHFENSNVDHTPPAGPNGYTDWIEPANTRLQVGAKLGYKF